MAHSILMRCDLCEPLEDAVWPAGVRLHAFRAEEAKEVHGLLADAYLDGGGSVATFPEWWDSLSADGEYEPGLVFVARDTEMKIAGVAQCWTHGYVKDLAVRRDWRRRGLGRALLLHAFGVFKQRGAMAVSLKVHADNPSGALRLYRSLGMHEVPM